MVENISGFADGGQARLDAQQDNLNVGTGPADDGKGAAFEDILNRRMDQGDVAEPKATGNVDNAEGANPVLRDPKSVKSMDDIMNMANREEKSRLAELMNGTGSDNEETQDFLKELAEKYGIPLELLMKLLAQAAGDEDSGNISPSTGGGSGSGGSSQGVGGGKGGSSGSGKAGGGSGSAQNADGSGDKDPNPEGQVHATSLDGKVKFHAEDKDHALKLKNTFDKAYANDDEFKKHVDTVIADKGSMNITAKDLQQGIAGVATVGGNKLAIDHDHTHSTHVLAHEILHNVGYRHGPALDAATRKASDLK